MNKNDIERMVSLADERYVEEMLEERITYHSRKRSVFPVFAATAAAMAVTLGGIWHFVNTAGIEEPLPPVATIAEDFAGQPFDYAELFKNKYDGDFPLYFDVYASKIERESTSAFEMAYALSVLPFKAEGFWDKRSQFYVYLDENGVPFGGTVYLESEFDETASPKFRCINIKMGKSGAVSHDFPVENTVPADRFGTLVYCFDDTAAYLADVYDSNLKAYFAIGDTEYAVETCNISAAETGEIIDSIINSGFSQDSFDLTRGYDFYHTATQITLDEANAIEPFAGYVPFVDGVLYLYDKSVTYSVQTINGEVNKLINVVYTDKTEDGERIMLEYYTNGYAGKEHYEKTVALRDITLESLDSFRADGEYKFTADFGKFMINVRAKCSPDKLMKYIDAIRGGDVVSGTVTLAEANNIVPFAGHVPQFENIGEMKLLDPTLSESADYGKTLKISYNIEFYLSNIHQLSATFTEKKAWRENNEPLVTLGEITKEGLEKFKTDEISYDGTGYYQFAVDCGGFFVTVNAWCTPEELWEYVSAINPGAAKQDGVRLSNGVTLVDSTLSAANKIQPFAGYVPQLESFGSLKLSAVSEGYFDGSASPSLLHMVYVDDMDNPKKMLTAHFYSDYKAVFLDVPKVSAIPLADISPEKIKEYGGNSFIVDCGEFYILIGANSGCTREEVWAYIGEIKGNAVYDAEKAEQERKDAEKAEQKRIEEEQKRIDEQNAAFERIVKGGSETLTLEKVKKLAEKGDELDWSDFENFSGTEVGSGLFIMAYNVENTDYWVNVGGVPGEKPWYVYLSKSGDDKRIDIRYDSIDDFLDSNTQITLTTDKIKELAKKGDDLTWSDFEAFDGTDIGSGSYIMVYAVYGTDYTVAVGGGSLDQKPMYIHFGGDGNYIDIRYDSIDDFLNK